MCRIGTINKTFITLFIISALVTVVTANPDSTIVSLSTPLTGTTCEPLMLSSFVI